MVYHVAIKSLHTLFTKGQFDAGDDTSFPFINPYDPVVSDELLFGSSLLGGGGRGSVHVYLPLLKHQGNPSCPLN